MEKIVIDINALLELKEMLEDEFQDLIDTYISDTNIKFIELGKSIDQLETEKVRQLAHSIKGSSVNVGVLELGALCGQLEQAAKINDIAMCQDLYKRALKEADIAFKEIVEYL